MNLFIDTKTNTIVRDVTFTAPVQSLSFKRGDVTPVTVKFIVDRLIQTPLSGRNIQFGIKPSGKYDADFLVFADDYTINGDGYVLDVNFNTVALSALFNINSNPDDDVASVTLMGEVIWSDEVDVWSSSNTVPVIVYNDVIRGTEASPVISKSLTEYFDELSSTIICLTALSSTNLNSTKGDTEFVVDSNDIAADDTITIGLSTYTFKEFDSVSNPLNTIFFNLSDNEPELADRIRYAINNSVANDTIDEAHSQVIALSGSTSSKVLIVSRNYGSDPIYTDVNFFISNSYFTNAVIQGNDGLPAAVGQQTLTYNLSGDPTALWICTKSTPSIDYYFHNKVKDF